MTRDAAAQAVHERLERAASSSPVFDVDAGWAALAAQLDGPMAPVIPLRRRRPNRGVALAVAAAVFVGGSALAMIRHDGDGAPSLEPIATLPASGSVTGPHVHPAFSGPPPAAGGSSRPDAPSGDGGGRPSTQEPSGSGSTGGGSGDGGSGDPGGSGGPNQDSPDDIDHGGGNDGQHDDNGGGNDAPGSGAGSGDPGSGGGGGSHGNGH